MAISVIIVPITTTIPDSDMNTLITSFEQELKKESTIYTNNSQSSTIYTDNSQSGIFSFSTPASHSFYGIQVKVITQNSDSIELYVIKEATNYLTFLKEHLSFYVITWIIAFIVILFLTRFLISNAMKPTENTLQSQKEFVAAASHELKAPLAVILSSAECINSDTSLSDDSRQHTYYRFRMYANVQIGTRLTSAFFCGCKHMDFK